MGQKVNPIGLRLGINRGWDSVWFDEKKFSDRINEDILIRRYIENRFNRTNLKEGLSCKILIRMIEGGKIIEANIVESSGNELFDQRAEKAVYSASPLPVPTDEKLFNKMRAIRITFDP